MALVKIGNRDNITIHSKHNKLVADIVEYQRIGKFCDVILCSPVQKENEDKLQEVPGHSCILASGSPFLHDILSRKPIMQKAKKRLVFKNMNGRMLKFCVDFLYGKEIKVKIEEIILLKYAADVLKIDVLSRNCMNCIKALAKQNDSSKTPGSDLKSSSETPHNSSLPIINVKIEVETPIPKIENQNSVCNLEKEFDYDDGTNYDNDHMDSSKLTIKSNEHDHRYATSPEDPSATGDQKKTKKNINRNRKYANNKERTRAHTLKLQKPRICSHCGVTFKNYYKLKCHRKEVEGRVLFCQYCPKTFILSTLLRLHEKRHRAEKNFACDQCDFKAVTKMEVNWHTAKHSKEATIVCEICGKSFKRVASLRNHKQHIHGTASEMFKCPHCPYTHPRLRILKEHMIMHDTVGRFECSHCAKVYKRKHSLNIHLRQVHNVEVEPAIHPFKLVQSTVIEDPQIHNNGLNHIENIPIDNINNTGISVQETVLSTEALQQQPFNNAQPQTEFVAASTANNTIDRQQVLVGNAFDGGEMDLEGSGLILQVLEVKQEDHVQGGLYLT